eukprot:SAG31_NODE_834_length_11650_cov_7.572245_2_plen_790_part_00
MHFQARLAAAAAAAAAAEAAAAEEEARIAAEEEAARLAATKEFMLMVMPSPIVESGRKLKCGAHSLENLRSQLSEALGVDSDIVISLAVGEGEEPTAVESLDDVGAKAKLQVWPQSHFEGSAVEERAAARAEAAAAAEEEAAAAAEEEMARIAAEEQEAAAAAQREADAQAAAAAVAAAEEEAATAMAEEEAAAAAAQKEAEALAAAATAAAEEEEAARALAEEEAAAAAAQREAEAQAAAAAAAAAEEEEAARALAEEEAVAQAAAAAAAAAEEEEAARALAEEEAAAAAAQREAEAQAAAQQEAQQPVEIQDETDFTILIAKNVLVPSARKLAVRASSLVELESAICASLSLDPDSVIIGKAVARAEDAVAFNSLEEVSMKAKLQVWPRSDGDGSASSTLPVSSTSEAVKTEQESGNEFAPAKAIERRDFTLLIAKNELVPSARKLAVSAANLTELLASVCDSLGHDPSTVVLCKVGADGPISSLEELPAKAKVQCCPASVFAAESGSTVSTFLLPAGPVDGTPWIIGHDDEDGMQYYYNTETEQSVWDMPEDVRRFVSDREKSTSSDPIATPMGVEEAAIPAATLETAVGSQSSTEVEMEFVILITKNEAVQSNRKLNVAAANLEQLTARVCDGLDLSGDFFLSKVVARAEDAVAFNSLEEVSMKAKLQVWPRSDGDGSASSTLPVSSTSEAVKTEQESGNEFAPAKAIERRDFTLLIAKNELVPSARKLAVSAANLTELLASVCDSLGHDPSTVVLCKVGADGPISSLEELPAKAKVQCWPASKF